MIQTKEGVSLWCNISFLFIQETPGSPLGPQQILNTSLDDHERRISHSLYGGLEGLDDNLMPRQGMLPRTIGEFQHNELILTFFFCTHSLATGSNISCLVVVYGHLQVQCDSLFLLLKDVYRVTTAAFYSNYSILLCVFSKLACQVLSAWASSIIWNQWFLMSLSGRRRQRWTNAPSTVCCLYVFWKRVMRALVLKPATLPVSK